MNTQKYQISRFSLSTKFQQLKETQIKKASFAQITIIIIKNIFQHFDLVTEKVRFLL